MDDLLVPGLIAGGYFQFLYESPSKPPGISEECWLSLKHLARFRLLSQKRFPSGHSWGFVASSASCIRHPYWQHVSKSRGNPSSVLPVLSQHVLPSHLTCIFLACLKTCGLDHGAIGDPIPSLYHQFPFQNGHHWVVKISNFQGHKIQRKPAAPKFSGSAGDLWRGGRRQERRRYWAQKNGCWIAAWIGFLKFGLRRAGEFLSNTVDKKYE